MAAEGVLMRRQRGFVLVLVCDESQSRSDDDAMARVLRDFDVANEVELEQALRDAAGLALGQLRLRHAMGAVLRRAIVNVR